MTKLNADRNTDIEQFLPFNWFDNAAVVWAPANLSTPASFADNVDDVADADGSWPASGLVLVGSVHNDTKPPAGVPPPGCGEAVCHNLGSVCYHSRDHGRTLTRGKELIPAPVHALPMSLPPPPGTPSLSQPPSPSLIVVDFRPRRRPSKRRRRMSLS